MKTFIVDIQPIIAFIIFMIISIFNDKKVSTQHSKLNLDKNN
jgi:hypothetical protein